MSESSDANAAWTAAIADVFGQDVVSKVAQELEGKPLRDQLTALRDAAPSATERMRAERYAAEDAVLMNPNTPIETVREIRERHKAEGRP